MRKKIEIYGFNNRGFDGQIVRIECDIRNGFPGFEITGLGDSAVKESRERVRIAMQNSGFKFPQCRVLVNLSPASLPKSGSVLDLGIALAILFADKNTQSEDVTQETKTVKIMAAGELTLNGNILQDPAALGAAAASEKADCSICLIPFDASVIENSNTVQVSNLTQAFLTCGELLNNEEDKSCVQNTGKVEKPIFSDIIGLNREKEILSMAAAGFHSILLFGPPGVGKSMLCSRIHRLLPTPDSKTLETIIRIRGCAALNPDASDFPSSRMISHDCSNAQFSGGQQSGSPGEGALAHGGVLLLDEMTKYTPKLLAAVKDAYDHGYTQCSKSGTVVTYPSVFLLAASMNPCPCGILGNPLVACQCTSQKIENHWNKVGKPLLERFDIRIPVKMQTDMFSLSGIPSRDDSYYLDKITLSVMRQRNRYKSFDNLNFNGQVHLHTEAYSVLSKEIGLFCSILSKKKEVISGAGAISCVCLARSIADYANRDETTEEDFDKAFELRKYGMGDYYWKVID